MKLCRHQQEPTVWRHCGAWSTMLIANKTLNCMYGIVNFIESCVSITPISIHFLTGS